MTLLCPRCERPLEQHKEGLCPKGVSRRFFIGALGAAFASTAAAKILPKYELVEAEPESLVALATPRVIQWDAIRIECNGGGNGAWKSTPEGVRALVESIAERKGRSVIGVLNNQVVHHVDAVKRRLIS